MPTPEQHHGVWLNRTRVGTLGQRGDYTWFSFAEEYLSKPDRPVLGLFFEQDLTARHTSALRLPPWFSNLLPEGQLRKWIAADRKVSVDREMELLSQVGHDLPGAVRILPEEASSSDDWIPDPAATGTATGEVPGGWRFSLAGVGLKFSMVRQNDRLTLPAHGEGGDWIVKLPDRVYPDVPLNEYAMMSLAAASGIEVPEVLLVHRDNLDNLPANIWPEGEDWAYAVRRFDRDAQRQPVHIEDLAQVRDVYPDHKYQGNFETVASLIYRRRDINSLREFTRRLTFNTLISNGDAHLKNWSLIYLNERIPVLSPAYDLVSTAPYRGDEPEDLGLKLRGSRDFSRVTLRSFSYLEDRLQATGADLAEVAAETIEKVVEAWPKQAELLKANKTLQSSVSSSIQRHRQSLLRL